MRQRLNGCSNGGKARNDGSLAQQPVARCVRRRDRRRRNGIRAAAACSNALRRLVRRALRIGGSSYCEPIFVRRIGIGDSEFRHTHHECRLARYRIGGDTSGFWLAIAWVAGIASTFGRLALSYLRIARIIRFAVPATEYGTSVCVSSLITIPIAAGLLRPVIVLPEISPQRSTRSTTKHCRARARAY